MRPRMLAAVSTAMLLAAALSWSRCFAPTYYDCAFRCASTAPLCPDGYECQSDGYCHLSGSTALCKTPSDLPSPMDLGSSDGL